MAKKGGTATVVRSKSITDFFSRSSSQTKPKVNGTNAAAASGSGNATGDKKRVGKRKAEDDDGAEREKRASPGTPAVTVNGDTPPSRKKQRVVPSSQSPSTSSPSSLFSRTDTSEPAVAAVSSPSSLFSKSDRTSKTESQYITPPSSPSRVQHDALTRTPPPIDGMTKTRNIIDGIRAKVAAEAANRTTPEPQKIDFKEELSDLSDDELEKDLAPLKITDKGKGKMTETEMDNVPRYSLRTRKSASPVVTRQPSPPSNDRSASKKGKGKAKARPSPPRFNPFTALLKEKEKNEKLGRNSAAFEQAAEAVAQRRLREEMHGSDFDDSDDDDMNDPRAAMRAVRNKDRRRGRSSSPDMDGTSNDTFELTEEKRKEWFGDKGGKEIGGLLQKDKKERDGMVNENKTLGVLLWDYTHDAMDMDGVQLDVPSEAAPILALVNKAVAENDLPRINAIFSPGLLRNRGIFKRQEVVDAFCRLAVSPFSSVGHQAQCMLNDIFSGDEPVCSGLSVSLALETLVQCSANIEVLCLAGLTAEPSTIRTNVGIKSREEILERLISLIRASASRGLYSPDAVPDLMSILSVIYMDTFTSNDLRTAVRSAINPLCNVLQSQDGSISADQEVPLCNRLISYAATLKPINKAHLVTLIASGSGIARRIARWLSHAILTKTPSISSTSYRDVPSALILLDALEPERPEEDDEDNEEQRAIFDVRNDTDFVDLKFYVKILGYALTNVEGYVQRDVEFDVGLPPPAAATAPPSSPSKGSVSREPKTVLQMVHQALDKLHDSIVDTRAADLNRSRAKAALKEVSNLLGYQRAAAVKSKKAQAKPRDLKQYFNKGQS